MLSSRITQARHALLVVLAILLTVGLVDACGSSQTASPTPLGVQDWAKSLASNSAWGKVTVPGPDGRLSLSEALQAFVLAVGPVPGVSRPKGALTPIFSADLASDTVLADFSQLDASDQSAVLADLGAPAAHSALQLPAPASAPSAQAFIACPASDSSNAGPFRQAAEGLEGTIGADFGIPFTIPVTFVVNSTQVEHSGGAFGPPRAESYQCSIASSGSVGGCAIHIEPRLVKDLQGGTVTPTDERAILAHELTHCFLYQVLGTAYGTTPKWYAEGVPTWVMATVVPDSIVIALWQKYLKTPGLPLDSRTYDAVGFWAHLQEADGGVFHKIIPIGQALLAGAGGTPAGWNAAAPSGAFLNTWGPGFSGGRYPGRPWETSGTGLPSWAGAPFKVAGLPNGGSLTVKAVAYASAFQMLDVTADVVQVSVDADTYGLMSLGGGAASTLAAGSTVDFCAKAGGCACPSGDSDATSGVKAMDAGREYLGITGGSDAGSVTLLGQRLASFCAKPCIVGSWSLASSVVGGQPNLYAELGLLFTVGPENAPMTYPYTIDTSQAETATVETAAGTVTGTMSGAAAGTLSLAPGTMTITESSDTLAVTAEIYGIQVTVPASAFGPGGGTDPYVCTAQTLTLTPPEAVNTWNRVSS